MRPGETIDTVGTASGRTDGIEGIETRSRRQGTEDGSDDSGIPGSLSVKKRRPLSAAGDDSASSVPAKRDPAPQHAAKRRRRHAPFPLPPSDEPDTDDEPCTPRDGSRGRSLSQPFRLQPLLRRREKSRAQQSKARVPALVQDEWQVRKIVGKRRTGRGCEDKVHWEDTWLPKKELENAQRLLRDFEARQRGAEADRAGEDLIFQQLEAIYCAYRDDGQQSAVTLVPSRVSNIKKNKKLQ